MKINIPETLDDITLGQYQEFSAITEPTDEDYLRIFLNLTIEQVNSIQVKEINKLVDTIKRVLDQDSIFTPTFILDGVSYGFIPKLDEITYGENKDLTTYLKDVSNSHKAMSVLFRPTTYRKNNKYRIEKYTGDSKHWETMKQTPLSIYTGALVFFCDLTNDLLAYTQNSLKIQVMDSISRKDSLENGDTMRKLLSWLTTKSSELLESNKEHL